MELRLRVYNHDAFVVQYLQVVTGQVSCLMYIKYFVIPFDRSYFERTPSYHTPIHGDDWTEYFETNHKTIQTHQCSRWSQSSSQRQRSRRCLLNCWHSLLGFFVVNAFFRDLQQSSYHPPRRILVHRLNKSQTKAKILNLFSNKILRALDFRGTRNYSLLVPNPFPWI